MSKNCKKCFKSLLETTNKFWGPIVHGDQLSWGPFVHGDQMFGDCLSRGTNCLGDHLSMGTKFLGTNCPGGPIVLGTKWAGTVCSWGPIVGDQMSGDWMCSGPNEKQAVKMLQNYFISLYKSREQWIGEEFSAFMMIDCQASAWHQKSHIYFFSRKLICVVN